MFKRKFEPFCLLCSEKMGEVEDLTLFLAPPGDEVGWALRFVGDFGLWGFWG